MHQINHKQKDPDWSHLHLSLSEPSLSPSLPTNFGPNESPTKPRSWFCQLASGSLEGLAIGCHFMFCVGSSPAAKGGELPPLGMTGPSLLQLVTPIARKAMRTRREAGRQSLRRCVFFSRLMCLRLSIDVLGGVSSAPPHLHHHRLPH